MATHISFVTGVGSLTHSLTDPSVALSSRQVSLLRDRSAKPNLTPGRGIHVVCAGRRLSSGSPASRHQRSRVPSSRGPTQQHARDFRLCRTSSSRRWRRASTGDGGSSTSTIARDSTSGEAETSVTSESQPQKTEEERKQAETKDVVALRNLEAYFEKLKGPEEEKKKQAAAAKAAAEAAAAAQKAAEKPTTTSTTAESSSPSSSTAPDNRTQEEKDAQEELAQLLEKLLNTKPEDLQVGQGKDGPQVDIRVLGMPSPYQQWLDAQLLMTPSTAVNVLLAINVAVFLFELASPEAVPGLIVTSLPSLLGAKVNSLIAAGEWWRLITPMFLHAGFFHILLGSLVLVSLGPTVEVAFGSLGLFGAYFVGGVFGNLMSYLQTTDVTVGGTGPIYGIVAAYAVYLWRNRQPIGKEDAEGNLWSLLFFASLNVAIGSSLPIDDWTHIGAAMGGLIFGSLAAPTLKRMPVGYSKLSEMLKAEIDKDGGKDADTSEASQAGSSSIEKEKPGFEDQGLLFLLERPDAQTTALVTAACLGGAALLLQFSSAPIPANLLDVSSQISL